MSIHSKLFSRLKKYFFLISKFLFLISFLLAVGIDAYYKFDVMDDAPGLIPGIIAYAYFSLYIGIFLTKLILKIKSLIVKLFIYLIVWTIPILIISSFDSFDPVGIWGSAVFVMMMIFAFSGLTLTLYVLHKLTPYSLYKAIFKKILKTFSILIRSPAFYLISFMVVSTAIWFILNNGEKIASTDKKQEPTPVAITLIQPWQLNSRFKINKVVKFFKVDLDNDGKEEVAAITSYDKLPDDVFYYAGFYRYNPATEIWDQFYGEELNIINYAIARDEIEPAKLADFTKTFIEMWSTEFTTLENLGDLTGDNCPEIVFSSLLQGKEFENYIIVAQAGESHYHYRIFLDQNTMATLVVEDGLLIEKYGDEIYDYKDIYEWDDKNLRFKLIESQKVKTTEPETPKAIPEFEGLSG